ncbi:hypothetical protein E5D57_005857 [Metarhizium anisopliae]|nr:hypothetical protein E5D57_005857 [Metarhizium anisopliae]
MNPRFYPFALSLEEVSVGSGMLIIHVLEEPEADAGYYLVKPLSHCGLLACYPLYLAPLYWGFGVKGVSDSIILAISFSFLPVTTHQLMI